MKWLVQGVAAALAGLVTARAAGLSKTELKSAKDLYAVKCAKCHKFYDPATYSQQEWDTWMEKMAKKAKLKPAQKQLLARYLQTFRD